MSVEIGVVAGLRMKVHSATLESLVKEFTSEEDADHWNRAEWELQQTYVGRVGTVIKRIISYESEQFMLLQFSDDRRFMFSANDLKRIDDEVTAPPSHTRHLTLKEKELAEKLLIAHFTSKDIWNIQESVEASIRASVSFFQAADSDGYLT